MQKQKFISKKWFIILAIVLLLIPVVAYAANGTTAPLTSAFDKTFETLAALLTQILRAFQKLLWPIMLAIGGLLGNDLLFGAGMESRLLEVWVQVRNFVNIIFVVLLLGVAVYNVIGFGNQEDYLLKKALPKIVIALILVNFSYVAMKVILDVTNVLTISVFALPTTIGEDLSSTEMVATTTDSSGNKTYTVRDTVLEKKICKSMYGTNVEFAKRIAGKSQDLINSLHCKVDGTELVFSDAGKKFFSQYTPRNASLILAIQLMNVAEVDKITEAASKDFSLSKLSFTLLFSVIIYILYAVSYIILFVILLIRLVVLWIFIALSPIIGISVAFPNLLSKVGSDIDIKTKFVKHAIAPLVAAVPMTLGYIMLDALKNVNARHLSNSFQLGTLDIQTAGISDLQTMIVAFGAVAIVWVGTAAAAKDTYAEGIVTGIRTKLKAAGGTALKALKLLPVIPAGAGAKGRISFNQAQQLWQTPMRELERRFGGTQGETGPLTTYHVDRIKTASEARAALGREGLGRKDVQAALARKIAGWKNKGGDKRKLYTEVERAIGGRWKTFQKGGFGRTSREIKQLQQLAGRVPVTTTPKRGIVGTGAPAGTGTVAVTAKNADIGDTFAYASANGLGDDKLSKDYTAWQQAKPGSRQQKDLEKKIRSNPSFQQAVAVEQNAKGSTRDVINSSNIIKNTANPTKAQTDDLKTKIKAAKDELKARTKIDDKTQKGIIRKVIVKSLGEDKYKNLPQDVRNMIE